MTTATQYEALTNTTAIAYAKDNNLLSGSITCEEIGDGNLNYVFRLVNDIGDSIIIKQALPYAKVVGESWPLTLQRATIEAETLKKHGEFVPAYVPRVLHTDAVLAITVMEDLSHLTVARDGLIAGYHYAHLAQHIGEYLAKTLFFTSDFALHPFEKKRLQVAFSNPELCKITEDLIFTDTYYDAPRNDFEEGLRSSVEALWQDNDLQREVAKLKRHFLTQAEALVHGDLHTGSIFVDAQTTKVIDPEFAFYGPIGFDVGQVIANFTFQWLTRQGEDRQKIATDIATVWQVFDTTYRQLFTEHYEEHYAKVAGYLDDHMADIFVDTLGYAGAELIRRMIGLAHVKDLDSIENTALRLQKKQQTLQAGSFIIKNRRNISSIEGYLAHLEDIR